MKLNEFISVLSGVEIEVINILMIKLFIKELQVKLREMLKCLKTMK